MSRLQWDQSSEKVYELGVDRGVIFPPVGEGFVWNGLVSVNETPDGGEFSAYYMDGDPYYIQAQPDNFTATIEAYTYPQGLEPFIGETTGAGGITYTGQTKGSFGLSYRTLIGTGDSGLMEYKIHLVYNAKLSSSEKSYSTTTDSPEPLTFSWDLNAVPVDILGRRDTAHIVIDSRKVSRLALGVFEGYLYGTNGVSPQLPSISQIASFFAQFTNLTVEYPVTYKGSLDRDLSNNLITNPGFDTDLSGWTAANGTFARVAGAGFDLTGSAIDGYARVTSSGKSSSVELRQPGPLPVPAGMTRVTIGVWAASDVDTKLAIQANINATSGWTYPKSSLLTAPWYKGRWITQVFELPADVISVGVSLLMRNVNVGAIVPSGKRMWADNFVMNWGITDGLYHDEFPAPWTKGDAYTIAGKLSVYDGSNWYRPSRNSLTLF